MNLRVDLDCQLRDLHRDHNNCSTTSVLMAELTIPREGGMEAAFKKNNDKSSELAAECREAGWSAVTYSVGAAEASWGNQISVS